MRTILALILLTFSSQSFAQSNDNEAIKATINRLFEGMKKGDSAIARSVFHPKAILQSVGFSAKNNKNYFNSESRLEGFFKSIGTPHAEVWDEKPGNYEIKIDSQMAQVWVSYEFYLGGQFNHCGIDNITLFKEEKDWKIIYLIDTERKENCVK